VKELDTFRFGNENYIVSHLKFPNMMGYEHPKILDMFTFGWILLGYIVHPPIFRAISNYLLDIFSPFHF
jgi:hypothetical protein